MKRQFILIAMTLCALCFGQLTLADDMGEPNVEAVNINTADAKTLADVLEGIGLVRAEQIVAYRDQYGPFFAAEELAAVKGIGSSTIAKNASRILVD